MAREIDYSMLPEHMREGTRLYIEEGIMTGHFLTSVMENDLVHSFLYADSRNINSMWTWAEFLYTEAPGLCWGSKEAVKEWKEKGGLNGIYEAARRGTERDQAQGE